MCVEDEIFDDLVILSDVFQNKVIDSGLVTENSIVVYNPSFGRASKLCGGADADIYIDGTLYDFKCTKKVGYVWNEVAQILGYYLLDNISKKNNDPDNKLGKYKIDRIAFYRARFGEIEYYDIREGNYEKAIEQLSGMLEKERDQEDLVKMKRQREGEKERRRREEEERKRLIFEQEYKDIERVHNRLLKYTKCEFFLKDLEKCVNKRERLDSMKANIEVCYNNRIQDKIDGKKLERKMSINGIDIKTLSQKLGKKQSTIKNWLEEKNNPTAGALIDMTEIFSCSINGLIKDNPSKKRYVSIWRAQKNRKKK